MKRTQIAAVGLAVVAFGTMSWIATAFVPMVEQAPPQKVAEEGGCLLPIVSLDGSWSACVDPFGQIVDLFTPDQPFSDNVFETLLYEASFPHSGGLSRRVETNFVVTAGPIVSPAGDSNNSSVTGSSAATMPVSMSTVVTAIVLVPDMPGYSTCSMMTNPASASGWVGGNGSPGRAECHHNVPPHSRPRCKRPTKAPGCPHTATASASNSEPHRLGSPRGQTCFQRQSDVPWRALTA